MATHQHVGMPTVTAPHSTWPGLTIELGTIRRGRERTRTPSEHASIARRFPHEQSFESLITNVGREEPAQIEPKHVCSRLDCIVRRLM
jgi:hypothetical protein